ncbi:hypothetical protein N9948_00645 [bacterium]|nr:hypothetical protein [bacterium]
MNPKIYYVVLYDDKDVWSICTTMEEAEQEKIRLNLKYNKFKKNNLSFRIKEKELK